jgi:hypothetical protein
MVTPGYIRKAQELILFRSELNSIRSIHAILLRVLRTYYTGCSSGMTTVVATVVSRRKRPSRILQCDRGGAVRVDKIVGQRITLKHV